MNVTESIFIVLKHGGEGCWHKCNQKEGKCDWCGTEGLCCRKGYQRSGCDGSLGSFWNHQCVLKTTTATTTTSTTSTTTTNATATKAVNMDDDKSKFNFLEY